MHRTLKAHLLFALVLTALPSLALAALRQEKFRLSDAAAAGDQVETDGRSGMDLKLKVVVGGKPVDFTVNGQETEKFRDDVLTVDGDGTPTGLRRTYTMKRETSKQTGEQEKRTTSPLEGKTVELQRDGEKVTVTTRKGQLSDAERQELSDDMLGKLVKVFPKRELGPGDEWTIDPDAAGRLFADFEKATVKCRFQDIAEYGGRRCARIHLMIDAVGKFGDDAPPADIRMTGDLYHALDLQRPVAFNMTGTITVKAADPAAEGAISGSGSMQGRESYRWLKVAGKAPAKP